jgi:hypothetical protein
MQPLISNSRIQSKKIFENAKKVVVYEEHAIADNQDEKNVNGNNETDKKLTSREKIYFSSLMNANLTSIVNKISKQAKLDLTQTIDTSMKDFKIKS